MINPFNFQNNKSVFPQALCDCYDGISIHLNANNNNYDLGFEPVPTNTPIPNAKPIISDVFTNPSANFVVGKMSLS
jgi:hypothetical protein